MTPTTVDLTQVDTDIRAEVLQGLAASGLSEQAFVSHLYKSFVEGQFSLLDLLGPNAKTLAAIKELEERRGSPSNTVEELFADLHADD
jgi:antitoxin component of RelBE/YafQ-DinJ toxin-antitoxin module